MTDLVTVERSLIFFRDLGFFADTTLSARDLVSRHQEEWGKPFDSEHRWADLLLLRHDTNRVWWRDTDGLWLLGESAYARTLQEWATISRGCFQPTGITEHWSNDGDGLMINFGLYDRPCCLHAHPVGNYLDTSILVGINEVIALNSDYRFEAYDTDDTSLFLVVLSPAEKAALQNRGWQFQTTHL